MAKLFDCFIEVYYNYDGELVQDEAPLIFGVHPTLDSPDSEAENCIPVARFNIKEKKPLDYWENLERTYLTEMLIRSNGKISNEQIARLKALEKRNYETTTKKLF